jgi:hypothetical protein
MSDWNKRIDEVTEAFTQSFASLSPESLNWKPHPSVWSVGQNIDHLMVINQTYFPVFDALIAGTYRRPGMARFGFIVSFLGKTVLDAVQPDRRKKMKTFPVWEPSTSDLPGDMLQRFAAHQTDLKHRFASVQSFAEGGAVISSPANRNIVYRLATALEIIVTHEWRHLAQAKEVWALHPQQASAR